MGHKCHTESYQDQKIGSDLMYETKEIVGHSFTLTDGEDWPLTFKALGMKDHDLCTEYVIKEAHARLFAHQATRESANPGIAWESRPEVWKKFLRNGLFAYTYAERIAGQKLQNNYYHSQDPASRQLIMQIYDKSIDHERRGGAHRIPCTMYYQLLHRGNTLYMIHNMRSCDLYTHFTIDMATSWIMVSEIAKELNIKCPVLVMQIASLHAFRKDLEPRGIF